MGALTFRRKILAAIKCPHSWTKIRRTNPTANFQPHSIAYAPIDSSIVPPVLSRIGRNLTSGIIRSLAFANHLAIKINTTPTGPRIFLSRWPIPGSEPGGSE